MPARTKPSTNQAASAVDQWLDAVASGQAKMSQRAIGWADRNGGLKAVVKAAKARGVHLVRLKDDKGNDLLAASREPFKTLC